MFSQKIVKTAKITQREEETSEPPIYKKQLICSSAMEQKQDRTSQGLATPSLTNTELPSSAKIRLIVKIRNEPPSLHWACQQHPQILPHGRMLALPDKAVLSCQDKLLKCGLSEQNFCGVLGRPEKAPNTESPLSLPCQNDRSTKSFTSEHPKFGRPARKV